MTDENCVIDEESTSGMGTVNLPSRVQYTYLIQHYMHCTR